jgi:hypothetical protein
MNEEQAIKDYQDGYITIEQLNKIASSFHAMRNSRRRTFEEGPCIVYSPYIPLVKDSPNGYKLLGYTGVNTTGPSKIFAPNIPKDLK